MDGMDGGGGEWRYFISLNLFCLWYGMMITKV